MTRASVHIETLGKGPDLVMLHGWAMHSGYFTPVVNKLVEHFRLHLIDLPGHGKSEHYPDDYCVGNLAMDVVSAVTPKLNDKAIWLGWSLGGCIATWIAQQDKNLVQALILVASNPCFVQKPGWQYGVEDSVLQTFASDLANDYEKTLLRFLSLQIRGADNERELLRGLRGQMQNSSVPANKVLEGGLEILRRFDSRELLAKSQQPMFMIVGQQDTLVPVQAFHTIAAESNNIKVSAWSNTGHAPFLSNADRFVKEVKDFIDDVIA